MCAILGNVNRYEGLLPLTENRPLATLPFDCKYRLIDFPLSNIVNANIRTIFMVFNEGETQSVFDHIGSGKEWNLDSLQNRYFVYFYQDFLRKLDKQGNPYEACIDYLQKSKSEYTVFMSNKMLCNIDLRAVLQIHKVQQNDMTIVYKRMPKEKIYQEDMILEIGEGGRVNGAHAYNQKSDTNDLENLSMDIYIVRTDWLIETMEKAPQNGDSFVLHELLTSKINEVKASTYEYTGYLSNVHDVKSYYEANMDMLDSAKFNSLLYTSQKIYTKVKNEVPTYYAPTSDVKSSQFATGSIIEGHVERSLISRNTHIAKNAKVSNAIVMPNARIAEDAQVEYAILDKNVEVQAGVHIQGTPEEPLVIEKGTVVTEDLTRGVGV
ncbi:glucose-1-phosphate adenylyltransferase, GlgD subunit [Enterococcus canis]|uniref:Glucose-1-phosphate adenylyltransferase, GlgD subunit n=2 Tax=Enterococcus canis TaxID=214095 RepID=A0A1L8RJC4_9ENTE|nr:glucose-1-phosphate adenylyltransferase, GlgD subunit [Enterococcus canis]